MDGLRHSNLRRVAWMLQKSLDSFKRVLALPNGSLFQRKPIRLRPVAVTGGPTSKSERNKLKEKRIRLHGYVEAVPIVEVWRYAGSQAAHLTVGSLIMGEALGIVSPNGFPGRQRTLDRPNQT